LLARNNVKRRKLCKSAKRKKRRKIGSARSIKEGTSSSKLLPNSSMVTRDAKEAGVVIKTTTMTIGMTTDAKNTVMSTRKRNLRK
jgi:hypothetical protein